MEKVNITQAFASFVDYWSPKVAGDVGDFQIKLAKFRGLLHWHHYEVEDELFLVFAGRLRMNFRDRIVDLDPGEFIVVPHGVEHCPKHSPRSATFFCWNPTPRSTLQCRE